MQIVKKIEKLQLFLKMCWFLLVLQETLTPRDEKLHWTETRNENRKTEQQWPKTVTISDMAEVITLVSLTDFWLITNKIVWEAYPILN